MKKSDLIFVLGLLATAVFTFRAFFLPGPLVWGDAPYFFSDYAKTYFTEPYAWNSWGKALGGISEIVWIHPLMFLWGLFAKFIGLESGVIIRILFYFPSLLLSLASPILLARYLGLSRTVQFFSSTLYVFNTYYLLLIGGGQVGVALAYGLFPLALYFLRKLYDKQNANTFYLSFATFFLLTIADLRVAIIAAFTFVCWVIVESVAYRKLPSLKQLTVFIPYIIAAIGLNAYWWLPTLKLVNFSPTGNSLSGLQLNSLLNSLFIFQPHWPANEFGKVAPVPYYFVGIPLLIFGSLLIRKKQIYVFAFCFLIFAFLSKGTTPPLGLTYQWVIEHLPFGVAFRDSTKIFIPLILFGGILLGSTVSWFAEELGKNNRILPKTVLAICFLYLIALVSPAVFGKMSGVLAGRTISRDIQTINSSIEARDGFFRTAWFPEHYPLAYHTDEKSVIDARNLVDLRPLAVINTGTQDRFNFLHNEESIAWLRLLGVHYLIFSGDPRKATPTEEEKYDWNNLLTLVDSTKGLEKVNVESSIPVYEVPDTKPHIFASDRVLVVVGGDDIYQKAKESNPDFSPANQTLLFVEDGKWNPKILERISLDSANLIFNDTDPTDLAFSFLQKYFTTPDKKSEWALRTSGDYLKYKYELLVRNISFRDFDYSKGIAFSTKTGEKLNFRLPIPVDDSYVVASRQMDTTGKLRWQVGKPTEYKKGTQVLTIQNPGGTQVVNTAAAIPAKEWEEANKLAQSISGKFRIVDLQNFPKSWIPVNYNTINPTKYSLSVLERVNWVVFTDSFNPMWHFLNNQQQFSSLPAYSAVNTFYVSGSSGGTIFFTGQKYVEWGLYISAGTLVILIFSYIWIRLKS